MQKRSDDEIRQIVRQRYGDIAQTGTACCSPSSSCCGPNEVSVGLGYSPEEVSAVPEGANMGLGCGNPLAIASLKPGETVLDLGSGGGFDCFLAANAVGEQGHVIGVDMTPDMLNKARENAVRAGYQNVEFRLGEIEHLPVANDTIDVILSNCVINLSPEKTKVVQESFRVLKPGGRLAISDVVATAPLPDDVLEDLALYTGCMAGAALVDDWQVMLEEAGFTDIRITPMDESREFIREWAPDRKLEDCILSASIEAVKP